MTGEATVVVHTIGNPGGELGATFVSTGPPGMAPADMMTMTNMSDHISHG